MVWGGALCCGVLCCAVPYARVCLFCCVCVYCLFSRGWCQHTVGCKKKPSAHNGQQDQCWLLICYRAWCEPLGSGRRLHNKL